MLFCKLKLNYVICVSILKKQNKMSTLPKLNKSAQEAERQSSLFSYHSGESGNFSDLDPTAPNAPTKKWKVGFEVEKSEYAVSRSNKHDLKEVGWALERDGSVCYELVSPTMNLFSKVTEKRIDQVAEFINTPVDNSCGGHINISREGTTPQELLNMMRPWLPIIYAMYYHRFQNRYCMAKKADRILAEHDKYSSVYLKSQCVELRIVGAVKNPTQLKWRLNLMRMIAARVEKNFKFSRICGAILHEGTPLNQFFKKVYTEEKLFELVVKAIEINKEFNDNSLSQAEIKRIDNKLKQAREKLANKNQA